jgi:hypothetical protein
MKKEIELIKAFYGDRTAERSGVPLINHIHEGLIVLSEISAWHASYSVYALHPLIQHDDDYNAGLNLFKSAGISPKIAAHAVEYRHTANAWLSDKVVASGLINGTPKLSPSKIVNDALIADKVQNRADFELYHKDTHERSRELDTYFKVWLDALGVNEEQYQYLVHKMKTRTHYLKNAQGNKS